MTTAKSPAEVKAAVAREIVEAVLLELETLPTDTDAMAIRSAMNGALDALSAFSSSTLTDGDHFDRFDRAYEAVKRAALSLNANLDDERGRLLSQRLGGAADALLASRSETIDAVVAVQNRAVWSQNGRRAQADFHASAGEARLHDLDRRPLEVHTRLGTIEERVDEEGGDPLADVEDEVPFELSEEPEDELSSRDDVKHLQILGASRPGAALDIALPGAEGELAFMRRMLRDCLEDLGSVALLRRPRDREPFITGAVRRFDDRMLKDLDAIIALGDPYPSLAGGTMEMDVLAETLRYANDSFVSDSRRAFARAFVMGCVSGDDTPRAATLALQQSPVTTYEAQAHALALSVNPGVVDAMKRLVRAGGSDRQVCVGLDVLYARGGASFGDIVVLLEHSHPAVRAKAAANLAWVAEREPARDALLAELEGETEEAVVVAFARALMQLDLEAGRRVVREQLDEEIEERDTFAKATVFELMHLLAVGGAASDAKRLAALFEGRPAESRALGLHGHKSHVEPLLEVLDKGGIHEGNVSPLASAARALARVTGAPLWRDEIAEPRDPYDMITDSAPWSAWWRDNTERFDPSLRYRFGEPFTGLAVVDELSRPAMPMGVRRWCAYELSLLPGRVKLDVEAFVHEQEKQIARARATLEAAYRGEVPPHAPGSWLPKRPRTG